ncbi:ATP-binding protein [Amycolatopsis palatopharyngis]|uniref:ATP-binding protein n=1 Tax=Amycolatopsis palatopharyngis TaxID=187982 RepID=UPI003CCC6642
MNEMGPPSQGIATKDDIELRLGAELEHLPLIRSLASSIAMRADFDLDMIADLKLAVDEACSTLIMRAVPETRMVCRFGLDKGELRFTVSVVTARDTPPSTNSFGWQVLTTLTDSASSWIEGHTGNGQASWVYVELTKRRPETSG